MQTFFTATALLVAASSAIAAPARRDDAVADTKVRIILRDDVGLEVERDFSLVDGNLNKGVSGGPFTTVEVDVGHDANRTLRCGVQDQWGNFLLAERTTNKDDTFSDATKGEWRFVDPAMPVNVRCDTDFVANNRNVLTKRADLDTNVRVILRDDAGLKEEAKIDMGLLFDNHRRDVHGTFTTIEVSIKEIRNSRHPLTSIVIPRST